MPDCPIGEQICSRGRANYHQLTVFDQRKVLTVTTDIGKEFAKHESIAKNLDAKFSLHILMPHDKEDSMKTPYGPIRQYFPKNSIQPYLGSASPVGDGKTR